jgi:hypothetical protein
VQHRGRGGVAGQLNACGEEPAGWLVDEEVGDARWRVLPVAVGEPAVLGHHDRDGHGGARRHVRGHPDAVPPAAGDAAVDHVRDELAVPDVPPGRRGRCGAQRAEPGVAGGDGAVGAVLAEAEPVVVRGHQIARWQRGGQFVHCGSAVVPVDPEFLAVVGEEPDRAAGSGR